MRPLARGRRPGGGRPCSAPGRASRGVRGGAPTSDPPHPSVPRGNLVQTVDVLGHHGHPGARQREAGERIVSRIGPAAPHELPAPAVPFPDEARVTPERFRGREFLRAVRPPEAALATERGHPRLRAHPRSGEHEHRACVRKQRARSLSTIPPCAAFRSACTGSPPPPACASRPVVPLIRLAAPPTRARASPRAGRPPLEG